VELSYVRPILVGTVWPSIKGFVQATCDATGGRRTPPKVLAELINNHASLWVMHDDQEIHGFISTKIVHYDAIDLLNIELVGGESVEEWLTPENISVLEYFAKENGCDGLEAQGRAGWKPRVKPLGLVATFIDYEKRFV
jgi:hypothetical protein